jgi:hypothetical protein
MAVLDPDNKYSTLANIQTKVRRLTRSLSENQLTTDQLNEYINTFVLYDFPEHLRLFNLHTTFSFYKQPYQDVYESSDDATSPLYNFKNKYITINPPVYVAGYQVLFSQSQDQFFAIYPKLSSISSIGTAGDGSQVQFSGVINSQQANSSGIDGQTICLLQNNVLFSSIDSNNNGLVMIDFPISNTIGNLYVPGETPSDILTPFNYINYLTGEFVVTFASAPGAGQPINSQTVPQQPTIPQAMLFYSGKFTMRPVPDQSYKVEMQAYQRPTEMLDENNLPELSEWWQYIAYGAAKKIFEDRMDLESVAQIMPEFKKQESLINRRTIVQNTNQRTSTIYTEQTGGAGQYGSGWFGGGGNF